MNFDALKSERISFTDSLEEIEEKLYRNKCTDGLPIVPPTEERVMRMIEYNKLDPQKLIAAVEPQKGPATVEKIAVNAVMAGCRPEYLPVVIAAVEAMASPGFDQFGVQATTHPCGMVTVVNGPVRKQLDINCQEGALGPGWRANATIGRAVRFVLLNIGGALPGPVDKATQGTPAKYTYCFGENEEESPWEPFHVERGYKPTDSTVTVLGLEGPHDINGQDAQTAEHMMYIVANCINSFGSTNFRFTSGADLVICFGPTHADIIARDGWSKEDMRNYLFEHARVPLSMIPEAHLAHRRKAPEQYGPIVGNDIPIVKDKSNFLFYVVGGAGLHSCWMPSWGAPNHKAAMAKINMPD